MSDYYHKNYKNYFDSTFKIDPSSFLSPLIHFLKPGAQILDVGCGSGRDLLWLKKRGFQVRGLERSPGLASLAGSYSQCRVIEGDFKIYDFSKIKVDAIILIGALVHINHHDFKTIFERIALGCKSGGMIQITIKEGTGYQIADDGRKFYLWQDETLRNFFKNSLYQILYFRREVSKLNNTDIWLNYILRKP
ncbi:methyltransferase domain-containing protein [Desulfohalobiaceae bacterium Ax17]|uniref:class I SAM-dependent methyltransferase n=1 Tax=Desulfovulcanus ferrireducens TaxID=2831190 RepID=UPI00207BABBC|nr:class I SAM-dependent methyltransferase [Desulfovulcanus ferrireducens]MBT8763193.1 methyltransferase domain-containing protein [Desulfovulcanus ferrireducens]